MSARTCDEKIAKGCCGYSPKQKIIGTRNWFLPAIGYLTIYGHGRALSTSPSVLLRLYRRRANYWKRSTTARMHFFFLRVLKASAGRSPKRRPAAAPYFVLMRRRCRKSPVAQPCCAISPMKMDSRKICYGCAIRRRAKNIVGPVCRMPRASAQEEWRNNISRFIAGWEWPHEEFSPAHFAAIAVANAARVSGAAIWFSDSSHCSHWSGLGFAFAFDHGREHQHWSFYRGKESQPAAFESSRDDRARELDYRVSARRFASFRQ